MCPKPKLRTKHNKILEFFFRSFLCETVNAGTWNVKLNNRSDDMHGWFASSFLFFRIYDGVCQLCKCMSFDIQTIKCHTEQSTSNHLVYFIRNDVVVDRNQTKKNPCLNTTTYAVCDSSLIHLLQSLLSVHFGISLSFPFLSSPYRSVSFSFDYYFIIYIFFFMITLSILLFISSLYRDVYLHFTSLESEKKNVNWNGWYWASLCSWWHAIARLLLLHIHIRICPRGVFD